MRKRLVDSADYWCRYCVKRWKRSNVAPPGGCLVTTCVYCGQDWRMAATPVKPADSSAPERNR
jgi:hypothetical protein